MSADALYRTMLHEKIKADLGIDYPERAMVDGRSLTVAGFLNHVSKMRVKMCQLTEQLTVIANAPYEHENADGIRLGIKGLADLICTTGDDLSFALARAHKLASEVAADWS